MDPLFLTPVHMAEFKISCREKKILHTSTLGIKIFFDTLFPLPLSKSLCCEGLP